MIPIRLFALASALAFAWEMLQMPGFTGLPDNWLAATALCAMAALADSVVAVVLFAVGVVLFGKRRWFAPPTLRRYAVIVLLGIGVHVLAERVIVHRLGLWGYSGWQPVVPGLDVGVFAVLQPAVILPAALWLLARWPARG